MKFWAKNARKRPKFGSKVAEISETLWPNARNSEKYFWQHCISVNLRQIQSEKIEEIRAIVLLWQIENARRY